MKRALLAATAIISSSFATVTTPAFAQVTDEVQLALNDYCDALVPPNDDNPPFIVTAINVVEGNTVGGGATVLSVEAGSEHRNGGSPNIFGTLNVEITGASTEYSFDCETFNPHAQSEQGQYPAGLQFPGQSTLIETGNTIIGQSNGVICISPGKNPGTWRAQNGYTGTCSTALFYSLEGIPEPIPSNSLPL
jgi:hypothetical protein